MRDETAIRQKRAIIEKMWMTGARAKEIGRVVGLTAYGVNWHVKVMELPPHPRPKRKTAIRVDVLLSPTQHDQLMRLAHEAKTSTSAYIRYLLFGGPFDESKNTTSKHT